MNSMGQPPQMPLAQPGMNGMGNGLGIRDVQGKMNALQQQIMQLQNMGAPPSVINNHQQQMLQLKFELQQAEAQARQQVIRAQMEQNRSRASGGEVGSGAGKYDPTSVNDRLMMQLMSQGLGLDNGPGGGRSPGW